MMIRQHVHIVLLCLLAVFSVQTWGEEDHFSGLVLEHAPIHQEDMASIKRGAKIFATTCMSCHTLIYLRYDKIAKEAGITYEKMPVNVKSWPYGVTPPDLSLEADIRGVDWIYTYLQSFYQDSQRPTGVNNLLVHNSAMPAILAPYQGDQILLNHPIQDLMHHVQWYDLVMPLKQGTMSPDEFHGMVADITDFLAYAAAPYHIEQEKIGWWTLGFLVILLIMMFFLKREYWRDVKKYKDK
jgi:ubiquinol-cytochrome c reductase cytochrome c1 subunit